MYVYGADCNLTKECEWNCGADGCDFSLYDSINPNLKKETDALELKIWWCGKIMHTLKHIPDYDTDKKGAFSYTVKDSIECKEFTVLENIGGPDVYCTGLIVKLPSCFFLAPISGIAIDIIDTQRERIKYLENQVWELRQQIPEYRHD